MTVQFKTYEATKLFCVGTGSVVVSRGDLVEFDGLDFRFGKHQFEFPQLRSAITSGWLVEVVQVPPPPRRKVKTP